MTDNNFLQDVIPPANKRSIRNIPIPKHRKSEDKIEEEIPETKTDFATTDVIPPVKRTHSVSRQTIMEREEKMPKLKKPINLDKPKKKLFISLIAGVVVLFFIIANLFTSASVTINPRTETINVESVLIIKNSESESGDLMYTNKEVSQESTKELKATGEKEVSIKSSGRIIVYNNFSDKDQPLVKQTRFESPDGKIYRIQDSITVPGQKTEDGKIVPGSIEVEVFADKAGEEYNIEPTDFTIPGFKNLPQFDGFYARSKTAMTGGFEGVRKVVNESDRQSAESSMSQELKEALVEMIKTDESTAGKVVVYDDSNFLFESSEEPDSGDNVVLRTKGTLTAKIINPEIIAHKLAERHIPTFNISNDVTLHDSESLQYSLTDNNLSIFGNVVIEWVINQNTLKEQLSGKSKSEVSEIFKEFDGIDKAAVDLKPFWKRSFPDSVQDIDVVIETID